MSNTATRTTTYTKVDVDKAFESFKSSLRLLCMSSGCDEDLVDRRAGDLLSFAYAGYVESVNVILRTAAGARIRALKLTVFEEAGSWQSEMPGDNVWPATDGGS